MRHGIAKRKLNRTSTHRISMLENIQMHQELMHLVVYVMAMQ
jgi:ribosomal protein L17